MGDKNAPQGLAHKVFSARHRAKLLLPLCLLVVGIVWSSSSLIPFSPMPGSRVYLRQCANCAPEEVLPGDNLDPVGASTTFQLQESLNVQDGRHPLAHTRSQKTSGKIKAEDASRSKNAGLTGIKPRKTLVNDLSLKATVENENPSVGRSSSPKEEGEENTLPNKPVEMEEMDILRTELSAALMQTEKHSHGGDTRITGDLYTNGDRYALRILDEIRSNSAPHSENSLSTDGGSCKGKYIYVYDLPSEFNVDLVKRCDSLLPWFGLCEYFQNSGFGRPVAPEGGKNDSAQILQPAKRWFNTHQYSLELVSHARILKYRCRTDDQSKASLFYIPYYGGLDVIRWHWALNVTNEKRDALGRKLVRWLENQPSWNRREGLDHVLVLGKISWDFRRQITGDWGSRLLEFSEMQKVTKLLIERNPWHKNDIGVPHPTFFHPKSASDIRRWLAHVESQDRKNLASFVGKDRHLDPNNVRGALISQCRNASVHNDCYFLECERDKCLLPAYVTRVFLTSHFCMQPPGDSPTRRSVFDSLVAGCIPVLFHPCTAYLQYPWHLPSNTSSWSVYISENDVKSGKVNVMDVLKKIPKHDRDAMRRVIIKDIIPKVVYGEPGADIAPFKDAFDIVLENLLYRAAHSPDLEQLSQN